MIDVIKHGYLVDYADCEVCGCKFTYHKQKDTKAEYEMNGVGGEGKLIYRYVLCPECLHRIIIR